MSVLISGQIKRNEKIVYMNVEDFNSCYIISSKIAK